MPATTDRFAYVASGTWSLVGAGARRRRCSPRRRRAADFTNEAGVDGRTRFLRNVGGLWLLQECLRDLAATSTSTTLLAAAAALAAPAGRRSTSTTRPSSRPAACPSASPRAAGRAALDDPAEIVRCILDSLAAGYARTLERAAELAGRTVDVVHIVGGGSQNDLLCQLTADATGRPVVAGPGRGHRPRQRRRPGPGPRRRSPASLEAIRAAAARPPSDARSRRYEPRS